MRSHIAATSIVSASISRSRKKSQEGTVFRTSSQCVAGSGPQAVPPTVAATRAHAAVSAATRVDGPSDTISRSE